MCRICCDMLKRFSTMAGIPCRSLLESNYGRRLVAVLPLGVLEFLRSSKARPSYVASPLRRLRRRDTPSPSKIHQEAKVRSMSIQRPTCRPPLLPPLFPLPRAEWQRLRGRTRAWDSSLVSRFAAVPFACCIRSLHHFGESR